MSDALRLIVNADDFGYAEAIDRGIVAAHDGGIVTAASIMATGESFEHAAALARARPRLDIGVHLTLTEQRPLVPGTALARDKDGRLAKSVAALARALFVGRVTTTDVHAELDAQIRRVRAAGLAVSHLDGHQHVHVLPKVARVVAELAAAHGIRSVRYPVEPVRRHMLRAARAWPRLAGQLALSATAALSPFRGFKRCDELAGFFHGGRLDEESLLRLLAALPRGRTIELMCHPGADDMRGTAEWRYQWAAERAALTSRRVRELVATAGIELISYRDVVEQQ